MNIFKRFKSIAGTCRFRRGVFSRLGDRRGAIALIYAVALPAMIGLVGLAVDFGNASLANLQLKTAADSAALLATTVASNAYLAGSSDAAAVTAGTNAAAGRFSAQTGNLALAGTPVITVAFSSSNGGQFQASATYAASISTSFVRYIGFPSIAVAGSSASQLSTNSYVSISVLMDASMSMLIAATQTDINNLEKLTTNWQEPSGVANYSQGSCAFACHWVSTAPTVKPAQDYYATAVQNNVLLRLTVLQNSVTTLINSILSYDVANNFSIGLYTFNATFNTIYSVSSNVAGALPFVQNIAPDVNTCTNNCPETYFHNAITTLTSQTTASGNGASSATPQKFLFIVTDGVVDDMENGNRVVGVINPADCTAMKNLGVTIMVLYTTYTPIPENAYYVANVYPYNAQIPTTLQSCSSGANYFFQATDASDIANQLNKMFTLVKQTQSHLIN